MACAALQVSPPTGGNLKIMGQVPDGFGVLAVTGDDECALIRAGEVVVFDSLDRDPEDGGLYALEWQYPVGGASWETAHRIGIDRVTVSRGLCRVSATQRGWFIHPLRRWRPFAPGTPIFRMSDGPYDDIHLGDRILGRVVGLYQPAGGR